MSKFVIIITHLFCKSAAKRLLNQSLECEILKRFIKIFTCLTLVLSLVIAGASTSKAAISSNAEHAILVDYTSGNVMYSKNAYEKAYPASTTKMMTAIVYYEKFKDNLAQTIMVTEEMMKKVPVGSSTMMLEKEEVVTREQLFYGLMLASGNDAAIVMAYDYGGNIEGFVQEMNNKAKQFGMDSTHFANPHGFHDDNHYTTAADFAILAREYMKYDELRKIAATSKYQMAATNKKNAYTMHNSNRLISTKEEYRDYVYEKATGLKTGFTNKAKNCFVSSASNGNSGLIFVGFGYDTTEERFTEAKKILEYGFNNFSPINVYKYIKDTTLYVDATAFNIPQYEYGNVDTAVQVNAKEVVQIDNEVINVLEGGYVYAKFNPLVNVQYPIKDGDYIGHIEYYVNDNIIYTAKAYASSYVDDRKVPALFETALTNKENAYGSKSFFEQAVSLGREKKDEVKIEVQSGAGSVGNTGQTSSQSTVNGSTSSSKTSTSSTKKETSSETKKTSGTSSGSSTAKKTSSSTKKSAA